MGCRRTLKQRQACVRKRIVGKSSHSDKPKKPVSKPKAIIMSAVAVICLVFAVPRVKVLFIDYEAPPPASMALEFKPTAGGPVQRERHVTDTLTEPVACGRRRTARITTESRAACWTGIRTPVVPAPSGADCAVRTSNWPHWAPTPSPGPPMVKQLSPTSGAVDCNPSPPPTDTSSRAIHAPAPAAQNPSPSADRGPHPVRRI